ncbi:unnamed protein product [Closterium sp. NIES-54]
MVWYDMAWHGVAWHQTVCNLHASRFIPPDLARPQPSAQSSTQASAQPSAPPATPVATAPAVEVAAAALSRLGVAADIASGTPGAAVGGGAGAGAAALARGSGGGTGLVVTPFDPSASRLRGVETGERRVPGVVQAGLPTPQQGLGRAQGGAQGQGQGQGQGQAQGQGQGQGRVEGQAQQEGRGRSQSTQSGGSSSGSSGSVNWWDQLEMNTGVAWPLQLVLSPTTLQRYNSVAAFLFRLRRVVLELQLAWLLLCKVRPEGARMRGLPQKGARGVVAGRGEGVRGGEGGLRGAGVGGVQGKGRGEAVGSGSGEEEGQMKRTWSLPAGSGEAVRSGGVDAGPATAAATAAAGAAGAAGFTRSTSVAAGSVGGAGSGRGSSSGVVRISLGERKEHLMLCMMLKEMLQIVTSLQTYLHVPSSSAFALSCAISHRNPCFPSGPHRCSAMGCWATCTALTLLLLSLIPISQLPLIVGAPCHARQHTLHAPAALAARARHEALPPPPPLCTTASTTAPRHAQGAGCKGVCAVSFSGDAAPLRVHAARDFGEEQVAAGGRWQQVAAGGSRWQVAAGGRWQQVAGGSRWQVAAGGRWQQVAAVKAMMGAMGAQV